MDFVKKALSLFLVLFSLTIIGTMGFHLIEGWDLFDSLYMSIITLTTVGYGEIFPLSNGGRAFVMVYLIIGLGFFLYSIVQVAELMLQVQLRNWMGRRKMDSKIQSMHDHFIVCGFGRMGKAVCTQLAERKIDFVAIDHDEEALAELDERGWHWLKGDATDDDVLKIAGIERARGLATVLASDADNLYIVISSKLISSELLIISRAADEKGAEKLQRAGADRVVSMYTTAGTKVAQLLANPSIEDFVEVISSGEKELDLAEIPIGDQSKYAGKKLKDTDFQEKGVMIVGIRRPSGKLVLPPDSDDKIHSGDYLIALSKAGIVSEMVF